MKQLTDKPKLSFATNFSWWFGNLGQHRQPASAGLPLQVEARLKPAQVAKLWTAYHRLKSVANKTVAT